MTTSIRPDELLTAVSFPRSQPGDGFGFAEVARRHGDFALVGVATHVRRVDGEVVLARLTGFGVSDRPVTRDVAEHVRACRGDESHLREVTDELAHEIVDTTGDDHGSTGYRRRLLGVLAARELARAHREATG